MPGESNLDLWWKNAIAYCVDVEVFLDSDGDGIGDFKGLTERVDYLAGLGVTCIWLMPFYPSPNRDDGYDICDYYSVDEKLGDMGDFTEFIQTANAMGIKVIVDLVVNHTSIEHPWFQKARRSPKSPYRDYYVWADEPPDTKPSIVFPGEQKTNWTYDDVAKQYYFHHFYPEQPDLNPDDPAVAQEMKEIMGFWIQQGLAGFRVDAVPFLIELQGGPAEEEMTPHGFLKELRAFITRRRGDSVLLGEVNLLPHEQLEFFGDNDQLEMIFNFYVNQHFYLALAREESGSASQGPDLDAADPPGLPVGQLRQEPRRAEPGQAHRSGARGGLRSLRAEAQHAVVRPRHEATSSGHARGRPAQTAPRLQPNVLPAWYARALLR